MKSNSKTKLRPQHFLKLSQWLSAGAERTTIHLCELVVKKESKAAYLVACFKRAQDGTNCFAYSETWLPKSQVQIVENDLYTSKNDLTSLLVSGFIKEAKEKDGYLLLPH